RSQRLEIEYDHRTRRADWMKDVDAIMKLARSNRIGPEALAAMGQRSAAGLLALLPKPAPDGARLDAALGKELRAARSALEKSKDAHRVTAEALKILCDTERLLASSAPLAWHRWVTLSKLRPAKACVPMVARLNAAAAAYERHPALHADLRAHTEAVFEAAACGLSAYTRWKAERRYVDYEDMIDRALDLVETPAIAKLLGERLGFLAVDEFQDTSPIQLALFVRLAELAGRSVWVGDRKQCIFEYAGADPVLMEAVTAWVHADGRKREMLGKNYRSRPGLVQSISQLFAAALARHDYTQEEVEVAAVRKDPKELAPLPCFGVWWLEAAKKSEEADAIAAGVRRLLAEPAATPVVDRASGRVRALCPGDVAILTATNDEAAALAAALERLGIASALEQNGLLARPEGALVEAGLRLLLDPRDRLAQAELEALRGFGGKTQAAWLADRLAAAAARRRGDARPAADDAAPSGELADVLAPLRARLDALSPAEAVDGLLGALDATTLAARWPEPERRLANLDALRALAAAYEEACAQEREAATLAGLLRYFAESAGESDAEHAGSESSAVQLSTYHKAKGLEWPVVILASLDRGEKRSVFDVAPETDQQAFDPSRPLDGRWIRFWPWPFGSQQQVPLADAADTSPEGLAVAAREDHELVRLLYVGFTRARDHLVLAATLKNGTPKVHWLDHLRDAHDDEPLLLLPTAPESKKRQRLVIRGSDDGPVARIWHLAPAAPDADRFARSALHAELARPAEAVDVHAMAAYRIAPSRAATEWPGLGAARVVATTRLAGRTP
ncbi:MAG: UvrD-helicase domain-containing protein, partial [Solirubrobacterales bacterium]|nr:UvrD-helicase domain-containing protein [Solirubrobacterales bacterium]